MSAMRRGFMFGMAALPVIALISTGALANEKYPTSVVNTTGLAVTDDSVTIGILHSITGSMALSETGSVQAEKLAIKQINESGGVLGRQVKWIQEDGATDWPNFAEKAKKLIVNDKVAAVMGCWTSASRKAVLPVFEQYNNMLYYPTMYEGLEASRNIIYTGQDLPSKFLRASTGLLKRKNQRPSTLLAQIISGLVHHSKLRVSILKTFMA